MRIDKDFAPITIRLSSKEELDFFRRIFNIAYETSVKKMWPRSSDEELCQKIRYVLNQLN